MSYNKVTKAVNRFHDYRVARNQTKIYLLYNDPCWLSVNRIGQLRKVKAMNCSCGTCRGWAKSGKQQHFNYQLEKSGMDKYDERPDIVTREEDWI